jgi:hypothetical protein
MEGGLKAARVVKKEDVEQHFPWTGQEQPLTTI